VTRPTRCCRAEGSKPTKPLEEALAREVVEETGVQVGYPKLLCVKQVLTPAADPNVISSGTGSGKTTLLGVLAAFIRDEERLVTIEDAAELRLEKAHVAALEARPANVEARRSLGS
jgi:8-oxo-dGTP pyrophosphatase MutT (NUDIX family)